MRYGSWVLTALILSLLVPAGCASTNTVVLVPDPDGHVGKAEVATSGGKRLLERPNDMTRVSGPTAAPSPVTTADPAFITATFADALSIEPLPAEKFILYFHTGTTDMVQGSQDMVPKMIAAIQRRRPITIAISGHTDASGSTLLNDRLSSERARFVMDLLVKSGIDPKRMTVSSHGKGNPLVPTPDGVAEPRNRRVEVVIR